MKNLTRSSCISNSNKQFYDVLMNCHQAEVVVPISASKGELTSIAISPFDISVSPKK